MKLCPWCHVDLDQDGVCNNKACPLWTTGLEVTHTRARYLGPLSLELSGDVDELFARSVANATMTHRLRVQ